MAQGFFDNLKNAGEFILQSEPFSNWLNFFSVVDEAAKSDTEEFSDHQRKAQQDAMNAWAEKITPKLRELGADLAWNISVPSYGFVGTAFGDAGGNILGDFPIHVNWNTLPAHSSNKSCNVDVSVKHEDWNGIVSLRQQYGESFLDSFSVSRTFKEVPEHLIQEMRSIPLCAISEGDPLAERTRRRAHNFMERFSHHPQYIQDFDAPFYFEPKGLNFSSFVFKDRKVIIPRRDIINAYLSKFKEDLFVPEDLEEDTSLGILCCLLNYIGPDDKDERNKFTRQLRSRAKGIYQRAIQQRNQEVAGLISDVTSRFTPLERRFFVLGHEDSIDIPRPQLNHYTPERLKAYRNPSFTFPQRVILKVEAPDQDGRRDFSVEYSRESFGDYCVWMRPENAFRDITSYVSTLGFN